MVNEKKLEVGVLSPFYLIRHEGLVDFDKLFNNMTSWFESYDYNLTIKNITKSVKPDGGEIKVELLADREVSPYVKFKFECELILLRGREVQVGKKRMRKGLLEIRIKSLYEKNWKQTFSKTSFPQFIREVYERFIAKNVIMGFEMKLWKEGNELIETVKEVLESFK